MKEETNFGYKEIANSAQFQSRDLKMRKGGMLKKRKKEDEEEENLSLIVFRWYTHHTNTGRVGERRENVSGGFISVVVEEVVKLQRSPRCPICIFNMTLKPK